MPITRYTASADTTITNAYKPYSTNRAVYANMGAADSLEMFSIYHSGSSPEISRILLNFPFADIVSDISGNLIDGSAKYYLRLFNVKHPETLPKNYYAIVHALSSSWDEGYGLDLDNYLDKGQSGSFGYGSNWEFSSTTVAPYSWSQSGGDYFVSSSQQVYFDNGTEDICADVTDIVNYQLNNPSKRFGFIVMLSGAYEDGTNQQNYYTKRFSARSSEYFYKRPILEARWESTIEDNRGNFYYKTDSLGNSASYQSLYFYNKVNGVYQDIFNNPGVFIAIKNSSGSTVATTGAIKVRKGVYKTSVLLTGSQEETFTDVWYDSTFGNPYYTGSFIAQVRTLDDTYSQDEYVCNITNLKKSYKSYEIPTLRIFSRKKNWSPNIYTVASQDIENIVFKNLYYKIYRIVDNMTIIDYGINPIKYTKCSYDKSGNFFELNMSTFEPGYMYAVKLAISLTDAEDNLEELREIFKFKVE